MILHILIPYSTTLIKFGITSVLYTFTLVSNGKIGLTRFKIARPVKIFFEGANSNNVWPYQFRDSSI